MAVSTESQYEHYKASDAPEKQKQGKQSCVPREESNTIHSDLQSNMPEHQKMAFLTEIMTIVIICAAQFTTLAGLAQSIAPIHDIGSSFDSTSTGELSWFPAAYSLTVGCFILPAGRWGDLYGHKKVFVFGYIWFSVWSIVAGCSIWSRSEIFFDVCRALQGIGPAILLPNGIAILARMYAPSHRKEVVLSHFGAAAPCGFVVGSALSGILAELVWWPWVYWLHGIGLSLLAVLAMLCLPKDKLSHKLRSISELDLAGTLTGVAGLVGFTFAWNEGPVAGWQATYNIVMLIIGVALLLAFVYLEFRHLGIVLLFLEVIRGNSILQSAAEMCPAAVSGTIAAVVTGMLMRKLTTGTILVCSMVAFCVGIVLVVSNPPGRTYWAQLFLSPIITSWGMDMSFPAGVIVLSYHMPHHQQGLAASLVNTVVNYSISIGLGVAGTAERYVVLNGANRLERYRAALYVGIGLDVLGFILAAGLVMRQRLQLKRNSAQTVDG